LIEKIRCKYKTNESNKCDIVSIIIGQTVKLNEMGKHNALQNAQYGASQTKTSELIQSFDIRLRDKSTTGNSE
jgi:hypothetical protein